MNPESANSREAVTSRQGCTLCEDNEGWDGTCADCPKTEHATSSTSRHEAGCQRFPDHEGDCEDDMYRAGFLDGYVHTEPDEQVKP